ncbi:MAG: IS630 family transposase [Legionellales bacterium]|nr:IS630 family transposase [Legionellales bacterium]
MKDYRLTTRELQMLKLQHRKEKRKQNADRLKALYLMGSGWSLPAICEALLLDENTLYRYYKCYKEGGVKSLLENKHKGSERKMTSEEESLLDEHLQEFPCRTTKEVIAYVEMEFDVKYSISGMNSLLKKLGFSYHKPQPKPGKIDIKAQKEFIKEYYKIRSKMTPADSLYFMDGAHPQHNPSVQCGWLKKGYRFNVSTGTRYGRVNINAAINIDTHDVVSMTAKKLDENMTLDFFIKLRKAQPKGWIYLVLDNAEYYSFKDIDKIAEHMGIKLIYLPPYSPNLNPIERLWSYLKKKLLYNRYFEKFEDFEKACTGFMKSLKYRKQELRTLITENFQMFD